MKKNSQDRLHTPNVNVQSSLKSAPQSTLGSPFQTLLPQPSGGLHLRICWIKRTGKDRNQRTQEPIDTVDVSVTDIASKDIVAIADLFFTTKWPSELDEEPLSDSEKGNEATEAHAQDIIVFTVKHWLRVFPEFGFSS